MGSAYYYDDYVECIATVRHRTDGLVRHISLLASLSRGRTYVRDVVSPDKTAIIPITNITICTSGSLILKKMKGCG